MNNKIGTHFKGAILITIMCLIGSIFIPTINVIAAERSQPISEIDKIDSESFKMTLNKITEYSEFDYARQEWILHHEIVDDGFLTEKQYQDAELAGKEWQKVENLALQSRKDNISTYALPALLILAIKAVGSIAGIAAVTEITNAFTRWGMVSGCKQFKKYGPIKSFCKANGFI